MQSLLPRMILRPRELAADAIILTSREASRIRGHLPPGPAIFIFAVKNGEVLGGLARGVALVLDYENDPSICIARRTPAERMDGDPGSDALYHSWRQLFRSARK